MSLFKKTEAQFTLPLEHAEPFEAMCEEEGIRFRVISTTDRLRAYAFTEKDYARIEARLDDAGKKKEKARGTESTLDRATTKTALNSKVQSAAVVPAGDSDLQKAGKEVSVTSQNEDSPTENEKEWAERKMIEELKKLAADQKPAAEKTDKRKKRKSLGRVNQVKTRLTDVEMAAFQNRVHASGLSQGDFIRNAILNDQIVIEERSMADIALLDEVALLRAELGRQGGLLKMIIKPNEGQRELTPGEWNELIQAIRDMEQTKKRLAALEVKIQHGNTQA